MAMVETYRGVVFPWLIDQMGHLTASRYVEMFDVASYHLGYALGSQPEPAATTGWADVRQTIDYRAEVGVGALLLIRSGVVRLGRTSMTTRHVMTHPGGEIVHAVMETIVVRFDLVGRKAVALPDSFAARVKPLMIEDPA